MKDRPRRRNLFRLGFRRQRRPCGIVIGTDGSRVYTVEGNSGDACKIKSYPLNYPVSKGYGLMNW